jgi:uncharacterized protein YcfL
MRPQTNKDRVIAIILGLAICLLISLCACKPVQKIVETQKLQHDTITIIDTVHITDIVTVHDSVYSTEYITKHEKDSSQIDVAWKHYTFDKEGNVTSLTDYTSSSHHGSSAKTNKENTSVNIIDQASVHDETSGHSESQGHSNIEQSKEQFKVGLTTWQRIMICMGYIFSALLGIAAAFGILYLYGKINKL